MALGTPTVIATSAYLHVVTEDDGTVAGHRNFGELQHRANTNTLHRKRLVVAEQSQWRANGLIPIDAIIASEGEGRVRCRIP
jgi:hypothetical protein